MDLSAFMGKGGGGGGGGGGNIGTTVNPSSSATSGNGPFSSGEFNVGGAAAKPNWTFLGLGALALVGLFIWLTTRRRR